VSCIITDPPYGVDNQSHSAVTPEGIGYARKIANDESPEVAIDTFKKVMESLLLATKPDCDIYIFTSYQVLTEWLSMTDKFFEPYGFLRKAIIIWQKDGPGMGDLVTPWGMGSEFVLYFKRGRREKIGTRRNNVVAVPQINAKLLRHPHQKPTALLELFIKQSTLPGEFIVDPFGGSGSTAVAAYNTERSCVAIEYDEYNFKLAQDFLAQSSGGMI
jgi:DNA modification methylase